MASKSPELSNGIQRRKSGSLIKGRKSPDHRLLPPGWERVKSQEGAYYYWDKQSGKTTWRYPEEEAKAHQEKMKSHNYENIQLQMASGKKAKKIDDVMKNTADQSEELVEGMRHTYVNVNTNAASGHAHIAEAYVTVPPPPLVKEEGLSPSSPPAPRLPPRLDVEREKSSPTPPLPERHYSDTDIRMSPPPPLPQRQYPNDDTLSPPPLPERHYTASDIALSSGGSGQPAAATQVQPVKQVSLAVGRDRSTKDRSKSLDSEGGKMTKYEISEMGNQYAVVTKGNKSNGAGNVIISPPPLPKRFRERFNEDSPYVAVSNESINQLGGDKSSGYVDIDHSIGNSGRPAYNDSIAYAVVKLEGGSDKAGQPQPQPQEPRPSVRWARTPRPYEAAVSSSTSSTPSTPASADLRPKRVPAYEEIDVERSPHKIDADGYTEVKRSSTAGEYAEVKRNSSTGNLLHTKTRTADLASHECLHPMKQQSSLDQPPLFPPLPPRPSVAPTKEDHEYHTLDDITRKNVTSELAEGRKSPGEVLSQDSVFDSISRYDLPSHSRKLNAMNVTLRRSEDPAAAAQGYAKLDLTKEALLLRSGVTLRRLNHYSFSSVSSFAKEDGTPEPEEGSELGSGTTPEAVSDEEDALEPVNKCIESMKTSLGVDKNQVDGESTKEQQVAMTKVPPGPPSWINYKRRPHAYEEVIQGGSQDETKSPVMMALGGSSSEISKSMTNFDMDWDHSDMGMGLGKVGNSYASTAGSSSQPNLLREAKDSKSADDSFSHLVKPERVSEEAFQLRKARLKQHKYEDIDESPGVGGAGGPVGDVNVLTSAVRESWLEGDKKSPPGKSNLPRGWETLKDEEGRAYYWHVPTGRTQYGRPSMEEVKRMSLQVEGPSHYSSQSPPHHVQQKVKSLTFSARYLGSLEVMESELIPGQCVEVVHSCVRKLTAALSEQIATPDQEKVVYLQVHNMELRWLNSADASSVTLSQPINRIRVWGIGLDNERDFGYVARDNLTKRHKCHVFRCNVPARSVASALLENHQQRERKGKATQRRKEEGVGSAAAKGGRKRYSTEGSSGRSTSPESEMQGGNPRSSHVAKTPTSPMSSYSSAHGSHEHYERIPCTYIGSCEVSQGMGMEVLNEAVDKLSMVTHRWLDVNLDVATSNIKISDTSTNQLLFEHRVRFLCFLGIARDDRYCGYILDGGERDGEKVYYVHGFKKEPNTDRLCLALHTACQARYKRVLEAHPEIATTKDRRRSKDSPDRGKLQSSSSSLFGRLGSLRKIKKSVDEEKSQGFVVQYCGYQAVPRQDGLDMVREVVQQLAVTKASSSPASPAHLVEFDISPSGLSLTDPQKKFFGRKHFATKSITYVLRIRNYFAYVVRESGKFYCHVFLETEVDAGTIVTTIQKFLAPEGSKQHRR